MTDFLLDDPSSVVLDLKGPEFTWVNSSMFKTTGQDAKCEEFSSNNDVQDSNFHTVPNSHFLSKNSIILFVYIFSCLFTFSAVYLHFQLFIYIINCLLTLDKKWNFVTVCSSLSIWRSKNSILCFTNICCMLVFLTSFIIIIIDFAIVIPQERIWKIKIMF